MKFPACDEMTPEQAAANAAAQQVLVPGKYYEFNPPVTATAVPTGGIQVCAPTVCEFSRAWYLGMKKGNHIFRGKPTNDKRVILTPAGCSVETKEVFRESFFHVLFIGGSAAILDPDQSAH